VAPVTVLLSQILLEGDGTQLVEHLAVIGVFLSLSRRRKKKKERRRKKEKEKKGKRRRRRRGEVEIAGAEMK